jgi:hypothetical protein
MRTESRVGVRSADAIVATGTALLVRVTFARRCRRIIWLQAVSARKANQRVLGSVRLRYATAMRNIIEDCEFPVLGI